MIFAANNKYYLEVVVRIIVAVICGGAIGFEREFRNKNVGVRTYMTVCLSTAVVMIIAKMSFRDTQSGDITRMAAAAIQGISFLGAGIIIHKDEKLKGITTAAILWGAAVVGLAIGYGLYFLGIVTTFALIFIGRIWIVLLDTYKKRKKK
jgi:putative Mg2+ transporter-C (MgtC) family protein